MKQKNLKDLFVTNIKLKGPTNAFSLHKKMSQRVIVVVTRVMQKVKARSKYF